MNLNTTVINPNQIPTARTLRSGGLPVRTLEVWSVICGALFFTTLMTYPLVPQMGTHIADLSDGRFSTYVHTWVAHTLATHPSQLWNMNFYFPAKGTLACSENWLGDQWLFAPVYLLSGNPVAAHNFVIASSFFLCAVTMYIFVRWLTGSPWAAAISGFIYGFAFPRLSALEHMQLLNLQWIPLIVLFLFSFFLYRRTSSLVGLSAAMLLQVLCSLYLGYLAALVVFCYFVGILITRRDLVQWRSVLKLGGAGIVTLVLLLPVVYPYLRLQNQGVIDPSVEWETTIKASASPLSTYLEVTGWANHVYIRLLKRFNSVDYTWEKRFFMGFLAMGLGCIGLLSILNRGSDPVGQRIDESGVPNPSSLFRAAWYGSVLTIITSYVISLGPFLRIHDRVTAIKLPFYFLRRLVPGFGAFRVPARFGFALIFGLSVLAGLGFLYILRFLREKFPERHHILSTIVSILVMLIMALEYNVAPYHFDAVMVPPNIAPEYQWLARQPAPSPIVELPITGGPAAPDRYEQASYIYASVYHWKPLVNGYTSHPPLTASQMYTLAFDLPSLESASILQQIGVRYVLVHVDRLSAAEMSKWLAPHPGLEEAENFGHAIIYRLNAPQSCLIGVENAHPDVHVIRIAEPKSLFPVQITLNSGDRCWVDADPEHSKVLVAEWLSAGTSTGKKVRTRVRLPLYIKHNQTVSSITALAAPKSPGDYDLRPLELDGLGLKHLPQAVTFRQGSGQNSINDRTGLLADYTLKHLDQTLKAGGKANIVLVARNTGSAEWLSLVPGSGSVGLGYRWIDRLGKEVLAGRIYLPFSIPPGAEFEYVGDIDLPSVPGEYTLLLENVSEMVAWFHDSHVQPVKSHVVVLP